MANRPYGVNVASLIPYSWGPGGPQRAVAMAIEAGFDGIQTLPLRGWPGPYMHEWETYVISWEDAWNHGTWLKAVLRTVGLLKHPAPTMEDVVLFKGRYSPYYRGLFVEHNIRGDGNIVEISPEAGLTPQEYMTHIADGGGVCVDTHHLHRPHRSTGERIENWESLLEELSGNSVKLIHVHLTTVEITHALSQGRFTETFRRTLAMVNSKTSCPAILEVAPKIGSPSMVIEYLSRLRKLTAPLLQ